MKTIAITMDDDTLFLLERLAASTSKVRSRSRLVRLAVRELAARELRKATEADDAAAIRKHRLQLAKDARAVVKGQARP